MNAGSFVNGFVVATNDCVIRALAINQFRGDGDTGPNELQNFPVLGFPLRYAATTVITGALNSATNGMFRIELFDNATNDPSGYGQGETYLGFVNVTNDAGGNSSFSLTHPVALPLTHWITANNAHACGVAGVKAAVDGQSGFMVKIVRDTQADGSIKWSTGMQDLGDIANVEHFIPRDWITEDGFLPNEKFIAYARPLIEGEVKFPVEGGLPKYAVLEKAKIEKKLAPRA